jgi:transposase
MEACAGSHYWGRELQALGHEVRLIPPQYVKPDVKTNKNDATDAEAISEALTRATMRFIAVKSAEQQSILMLHRTRELLVRQRTTLVNALRGIAASSASLLRKDCPAPASYFWVRHAIISPPPEGPTQ